MNIEKFINEKFGSIRVITKDGTEWFVAKDIAECLGYKDTDKTIRDHVDDDYKKNFDPAKIAGSKNKGRGGPRHIIVINQYGDFIVINNFRRVIIIFKGD